MQMDAQVLMPIKQLLAVAYILRLLMVHVCVELIICQLELWSELYTMRLLADTASD